MSNDPIEPREEQFLIYKMKSGGSKRGDFVHQNRPNIISIMKFWLLYLTNDDLEEMKNRIDTIVEDRKNFVG